MWLQIDISSLLKNTSLTFPATAHSKKYSKQILEAFLEAGRLATVSKQTLVRVYPELMCEIPQLTPNLQYPYFYRTLNSKSSDLHQGAEASAAVDITATPDSNLHLLIKLLYTLTVTTTEHFIRCDNLRGS